MLTLPEGSYQWSIQAANSSYQSITKYLSLKVTEAEQ
jgi:hypothetical protein